jgi:hypothetical protein
LPLALLFGLCFFDFDAFAFDGFGFLIFILAVGALSAFFGALIFLASFAGIGDTAGPTGFETVFAAMTGATTGTSTFPFFFFPLVSTAGAG